LAELCRELAAVDQEGRDGGHVAVQDLLPFPDVKAVTFTGRQPLLNALARVFEDLRMISQALSDGAVIRDAPLFSQPVEVHIGKDGKPGERRVGW
jgi:hypothetical protein